MKLKRAILDELDKKHSFDLPPQMVEAEFGNIWSQVQAEKSLMRTTLRKLISSLKKTIVKSLSAACASAWYLRQYPGQEQQVIEFYQKNPQAIAQLRAPIYEEKVVDLIIEKAKVTDKKVTKDVLFEEDGMI